MEIIDSYFRCHAYPWTKHHIDSYRSFLKTYLPNAIISYNPIEMIKKDQIIGNDKVDLKVLVYVGGKSKDPANLELFLDSPSYVDESGAARLLTPKEARMRNLTYQTTLTANIIIEFQVKVTSNGQSKQYTIPPIVHKKVPIAAIPIMLHSDACVLQGLGPDALRAMGECQNDHGGYFIVDGKEKVIVSQERVTTNRLFTKSLSDHQDFAFQGQIRCTSETGEYALIPRTVDIFLVRKPDPLYMASKMSEVRYHERDVDIDVRKPFRDFKGSIMVNVPGIAHSYVPLCTLFRALGIESDRDILECIFGDLSQTPKFLIDFIRPSIAHAATNGVPIPKKADRKVQAPEVGPTPVFSQEKALEVLRLQTFHKTLQQLRIILTYELFPNIDIGQGSLTPKAQFLGYLVNEFIKVAVGMTPESDRDGYIFQRVDISGFLVSQLFQESYNSLRKNCRDNLDREYFYGSYPGAANVDEYTKLIPRMGRQEKLRTYFPISLVSEDFQRSFKGAWRGKKASSEEERVVQDLSRISYIGYLSHLRRVKNPLDPSLKLVPPHRLHSQQWGIMCPFESPDGANIGYIKNFAIMTNVTFGTSVEKIRRVIAALQIVIPIRSEYLSLRDAASTYTRVFVNGDIYGCTDDPKQTVDLLRLLRRNGFINPFVSISWNIVANEIRIQTEAGRPCRPLIIVKNGVVPKCSKSGSWFEWLFGTLPLPDNKAFTEEAYYKETPRETDASLSKLTKEEYIEMLKQHAGCIEYLDIEEENGSLIAMMPEDVRGLHTHCEIHPSTIFSVVTNTLPFANHNAAPRNVFYGGQSKQGIGIYATNFTERFDTMSYINHYPQRPIVTTRLARYIGNDSMPNGFNAIVAVMTYSGFNQEDSIIINKTAIDRGLFQITAYKTMSATEELQSGFRPYPKVRFGNPLRKKEDLQDGANVKVSNFANYSLLDDNGIVKPESYIPRGQSAVVIGMIQETEKPNGTIAFSDRSKVTDIHHYGRIDRVEVLEQGVNGKQRVCKVRFRKVRRPELGDKAVSRSAQKGVFGAILPAESMPFTKDGVIPDLIINPHAIPTRMTIAHLVECIYAKLCTCEGMIGDGTVFLPLDLDDKYARLENKFGFERHGNEVLYNGMSGEMIHTDIFIGPTYYMRLKHMVTDKINYRGAGSNPFGFEPSRPPTEVGRAPQDQLTRQPTAGRSKGGGLRIGEMERDVLLSHGLAQFAKECMMEKADKYIWSACRHCGVMTHPSSRKDARPKCAACGSQDAATYATPYAFKLLVQEMESMGLQIRLSDMPFDIEFTNEHSIYASLMDEEPDSSSSIEGGGIVKAVPGNFRMPVIAESEEAEPEPEEADEDDNEDLYGSNEDDEDDEDLYGFDEAGEAEDNETADEADSDDSDDSNETADEAADEATDEPETDAKDETKIIKVDYEFFT